MKVFFIGVFDNENKSTNNSQAAGFENAGCEVYRYSFRERIERIEIPNVEFEVLEKIKEFSPDFVLISKCSELSQACISTISKLAKTCYWYMDPPSSVNEDILKKSSLCSISTIAWEGNYESFEKYNKNCHVVIEGFDSTVDKPTPHPDDWKDPFDVSFIGSLHSNRRELLEGLNPPVVVVGNAFGNLHSQAVSNSKINLNISTAGGASDRVFKVMAAGGFLLTDTFVGLDNMFIDGKHLVVFDGKQDLQEKIEYYLQNEVEREEIAKNGLSAVQKFSRDEWARKILGLMNDS